MILSAVSWYVSCSDSAADPTAALSANSRAAKLGRISISLHADFFEVNRRPPVMVLQPHVSGIRPRTAHRLVPGLALGYRLMTDAGELVDHFAVQLDDGSLPFERDVHSVPFAHGFLVPSGHFAQRIDRPGAVPLIAARVDLHFVAVMHGVPGVFRFFRETDVDARIGIGRGGLEYHANGGVAELLA